MSIILSIETATPVCSVAIHNDQKLVSLRHTDVEKSHSELLAVFIKEVLAEAKMEAKALDAVAISEGPGSYTGLRIGASAAKGLCYAADLPLISVSTLLGLAEKLEHPTAEYLCPMLDARRMEVYCLITDRRLNVLQEARPEIIEGTSFEKWLDHEIAFFGNGASKCKEVITADKAIFIDGIEPSADAIGRLAANKYNSGDFEDLASFEPRYLKEFMIKKPKSG